MKIAIFVHNLRLIHNMLMHTHIYVHKVQLVDLETTQPFAVGYHNKFYNT